MCPALMSEESRAHPCALPACSRGEKDSVSNIYFTLRESLVLQYPHNVG